MAIPPGIVYLSSVLPGFIVPPILISTVLKWAKFNGIADPHVSTWMIILLYIFAKIFIFFGGKRFNRWRDIRKAAALGAKMPPYIPQSSLETTNELKMMVEKGYPGDVLLRWTEKYGEVVLADVIMSTIMVTHEPAHVKALLATQFDSFGKSDASQEILGSFLGTGIFNSNGDMWKFHRGITRPFFTRERISDFEIYERNSRASLNAAERRLAEGYSVDIQDLFGRFTLDSATEFLFGQTVDSLSADLPYPPSYSHKNAASYYNHPSNVFVKAFTQGLQYTAERTGMGAAWRLFEFGQDKIKPLREVVDDFTKPMIQKALTSRRLVELNKNAQKNKGAETVIDSLVDQTQDEQVLKDETMSLLTFSIYMLSQNHAMERRLRQEIFNIVGHNSAPTYDQMRDMKYMRAFLNEVLRLYPPVPIDARMAMHDVVLPSTHPLKKPIFVPKNTDCFYSVMNIHRRTDLWGPDALVFDPDRFIDERLHKYLTPNPFIFCPFNAGPRICLGQQFAYHEASYYMVRLLQQFTEFTLDDTANVSPPAEWKHGEGRKPLEKI